MLYKLRQVTITHGELIVYNHYITAFIANLYYTKRYKISCLLNNIISAKTRIVKFDEQDFTDLSKGCNFF